MSDILDKAMIRHLSIGFAMGAVGLLTVSGVSLIPQAIASAFV